MTDFDNVLTWEERTVFALRRLYRDYGYQQYRMSKFEEYDLYARNKDFLVSDGIITFNDKDGRLLALKPDVTLSIIKNTKPVGDCVKLFYNENVYRPAPGTGSFREIMQTGVEYIGNVDTDALAEVVTLAKESLLASTDKFILELSDMDVTQAILSHLGIAERGGERVIECLKSKNAESIISSLELTGEGAELLSELIRFHQPIEEAVNNLRIFEKDEKTASAIRGFTSLLRTLIARGETSCICVDFSAVNNTRYYNGLAFRGFAEGAPSAVLLGGRYDKLMRRMKRDACAVGFAVYVDELAQAGRKNG